MQQRAPATAPPPDRVRAPTPRPGPAASSLAVARTPCWDRPNVSAERRMPAATPSPDWPSRPRLVSARVRTPAPGVARQPRRLSPGPAPSSLPVERMPCWDRPGAAVERRAPPLTRSPNSVPASAPVAAKRPLLSAPARVASNPSVERMPCWDRPDAAVERGAPQATRPPNSARGPVLKEPPSPRSVRAVTVSEPAAARQRGPAAPNRPAARRPCSDPQGVVAQRQAPEQMPLRTRRWRPERTAMAATQPAPTRRFPERHLLA